MKLQELMGIVKDDIMFAKRIAHCNNKDEALQYLKAAQRHAMALLLYNVRIEESPDIQKTTYRQRHKYVRKVTRVATEFDVALNKLYGQEIEEGKEYTSEILPWGLLVVDNKKYPIYADDPGQCDYIVIDGECYSGGSYNFSPEGVFVREIINHIYSKAIKEIKGE